MTCDELCILKSPSVTVAVPGSTATRCLSGKSFPIIRASKSTRCAPVSHPQYGPLGYISPATVAQTPSDAYEEELSLEMQSNGFLLDYVIHANNGVRGSHCIEVTLRQVDIAWPFMEDFNLILDVIRAYSSFVNVDFVMPYAIESGKQAWSFVNVVLEHGQALILSPDSVLMHSCELSKRSWYPTAVASWERLRFGYDWGGIAEVALLVNCVAFRLALASDMKMTVLHRGWVLRKHTLDLHELISPFDATLNWDSCTSMSPCHAIGGHDCQEYISHVSSYSIPSTKGPISDMPMKSSSKLSSDRQKQNASIACSMLKLQLATGSSPLVQSLLHVVQQWVDQRSLWSQSECAPQHDVTSSHQGSPSLPSAMLLIPSSMCDGVVSCTCDGVFACKTHDHAHRTDEELCCPADMRSCDQGVPDDCMSQSSSILLEQTSAASKCGFANRGAVLPQVHASFSDALPSGSASAVNVCLHSSPNQLPM